VKVTETKLKDVLLVEPRVFADARGFFFESYNQKAFIDAGIGDNFIQDNMSRSVKGTLRGLHYQLAPHTQGKLVRCTLGEVFDVAVDIRRNSPNYGKWVGVNLSADNKHALWVPAGFAHGFLTLSEYAEFSYKCTNLYEPTAERSLIWNDPDIGIEWPIPPNPDFLSAKDKIGKKLKDAEINF
jgi:dTDP-4-dehydrorhamnose 3,5-epimerase